MNKGIAFFDFSSMHYFNDNPKDADYQRDRQLPFKSVEIHTNISVLITSIQDFEPNKTFYSLKKMFGHQNQDFYSSSYLDNIWQPPKA